MELNNLKIPIGSRKSRKRLGRGPGSGLGTTAGKGTKGQKARSGGNVRRGFEGGQMPLSRRIPKRGFTNIHKKTFAVVNVGDLDLHFSENSTIGPIELHDSGLVKKSLDGIKILGFGEIKKPITIKAHSFSKTAVDKIQAAGGTIEELK